MDMQVKLNKFYISLNQMSEAQAFDTARSTIKHYISQEYYPYTDYASDIVALGNLDIDARALSMVRASRSYYTSLPDYQKWLDEYYPKIHLSGLYTALVCTAIWILRTFNELSERDGGKSWT